MTDTKPPLDRIRLGLVQAAIWKNTDSEGRTYYATTFEKRYQDAGGDWQATASFHRDDLLLFSKAADMAFDRIQEAQSQDRVHAAQANSNADSGR